MSKKIKSIFILCLIFTIALSTNVYASDSLNETNIVDNTYSSVPDYENIELISEDDSKSRSALDGYTTFVSREFYYGNLKYGSWRNAVSGAGPLTISVNQQYDKSFDISFSATFSGDSFGKSGLGGALGVSVGYSSKYSFGSGASVAVPSGQRWVIRYRPAYYTVKVTEKKYGEKYIYGIGWHRVEYGTKVCYVDKYSHWDYGTADANYK